MMKFKFWEKKPKQVNFGDVINVQLPIHKNTRKVSFRFTDQENIAKQGDSNFVTNSFIPFPLSRAGYANINQLERLNCILDLPFYVTYNDYNYLYNRHPIARAVCDIYPDNCWSPMPIILESNNTTGVPETEFEKVCAQIVQKTDLFNYMKRLDKASRIGQYGVMYVDFNDEDRTKQAPDDAKQQYSKKSVNPATLEKYSEPPDFMPGMAGVNWESIKGMGADAINYVVVYEQPNAWPTQYIVNNSDPSFPLVNYYNLQSGGQVFGGGNQTSNIIYGASLPVTWNVVHASRCIHCCENNIGNNILGIPALSSIYNDLIADIRVSGGSAMVYQLNARGGLVFNVKQDENQSMSQQDADDLKYQVRDYTAGYERAIIADGLTVQPINFKVDQIDKTVGVYNQNIAAGARVPTRILFGNESGKMASSEDSKVFDTNVKTRQSGWCTEKTKMFFDPLIKNEVIPQPDSGSYVVFFPVADDLDNATNATIFNQVTLGLAGLANSKSVEIDDNMQGFIDRAKEITKVKDDSVMIPAGKDNYLRPDLRVDDLVELDGENGGIETY